MTLQSSREGTVNWLSRWKNYILTLTSHHTENSISESIKYVKVKTIKFLKGNVSEYLHDLGVGKNLLNRA